MEFTSLWDDASRDAEAEARSVMNVRAKIAAAPAWSFLANARTKTDFEARLEYAADRLYLAAEAATRDNPQCLETVYATLLESLREDFTVISKEWKKPWEDDTNDDDDAEGDKEDSTDEDENDSEDENTDNDADDDDNDDDDSKGKKSNEDNEDGDKDDKKGKNPFGKKATYPGHNNHSNDAYQRPFNWDGYHKTMNDYGSAPGPSVMGHDGDVEPDWNEYDQHGKSCPTCGHMGSRRPLVKGADHGFVGPNDDMDDHVEVYHGNAHEWNQEQARNGDSAPADEVHNVDHKEHGPHGSGKSYTNYAWEKEGTSKTASWIIVNEKSKRKAAGPFKTVAEAQDRLTQMGEGYELEEEKEASLQHVPDLAGTMGPHGEIEKEGESEQALHYKRYGEPPPARVRQPFDWDAYHAQVKTQGHAEGPIDARGEPNWNAYDRHRASCPTCRG